ncbi:hypothetical protein [Gordonia otitidis]|uniref:hypothetical protein n=1 Tax=Gordonia otitidis TaxID=249058 RepID=UPI001110A96E|nr:hypothetical protein [Gordonia otitidis]
MAGNEDNLVAMDAVAVSAGEHFRYPASGGPRIPISEAELEYVHRATDELTRRWTPGDIVWFAGKRLVALSDTDHVLRGFAATWAITRQGHRLKPGSAASLRVLRDGYAQDLSNYLRRCLMDPMERNVGQAERTLRFYLAIENTAARRRFMNTALYYHELYDTESYEFERESAVHSGAFGSAEEFDREFDRLVMLLRKDRIRGTATQYRPNVFFEGKRLHFWLGEVRQHVLEAQATLDLEWPDESTTPWQHILASGVSADDERV